MKIMLVIIADLFIAVAAVFGAYEYFGMKRHASFTVPFTKKMVERKILSSKREQAIINEDRVSHYIGMGLSLLVGVLMSRFIAGISGYIVLILIAGSAILLLKPDLTETTATRTSYYNAHKDDMDVRRYHEYLVEVGDAVRSDIIE